MYSGWSVEFQFFLLMDSVLHFDNLDKAVDVPAPSLDSLPSGTSSPLFSPSSVTSSSTGG